MAGQTQRIDHWLGELDQAIARMRDDHASKDAECAFWIVAFDELFMPIMLEMAAGPHRDRIDFWFDQLDERMRYQGQAVRAAYARHACRWRTSIEQIPHARAARSGIALLQDLGSKPSSAAIDGGLLETSEEIE